MSTALQRYAPEPMTGEKLQVIKDVAREMIQSGFLPAGIDTPAKAMAVGFMAHAYGVDFVIACQHAYVIKGKVGFSTEFKLGVVLSRVPDLVLEVVDLDDEKCTVRGTRGKNTIKVTYTYKQAEQAGLVGKEVWRFYRQDMLWNRAVTRVLKKLAPDAMLGLGGLLSDPGEAVTTSSAEVVEEAPDVSAPEAAPEPAAAITRERAYEDFCDLLTARGYNAKHGPTVARMLKSLLSEDGVPYGAKKMGDVPTHDFVEATRRLAASEMKKPETATAGDDPAGGQGVPQAAPAQQAGTAARTESVGSPGIASADQPNPFGGDPVEEAPPLEESGDGLAVQEWDGTPDGLLALCERASKKFPTRIYIKRTASTTWFMNGEIARAAGFAAGVDILAASREQRLMLARGVREHLFRDGGK